ENEANSKNADFLLCNMDNLTVKKVSHEGGMFDFKYRNAFYSDLKINMLGEFQIYNAALALTNILELRQRELVKVTDDEIRKGLEKTKWNGRLEVLKKDPLFLIDAAHNPQSAKHLSKSISIFEYDKLILGIAVLEDKDVDHVIEYLVPLADEIVINEVNIPRKMKSEELAKKIQKYNNNYVIEENIENAVDKSLEIANKNALILFAGSIYLIGDVRKIVTNK